MPNEFSQGESSDGQERMSPTEAERDNSSPDDRVAEANSDTGETLPVYDPQSHNPGRVRARSSTIESQSSYWSNTPHRWLPALLTGVASVPLCFLTSTIVMLITIQVSGKQDLLNAPPDFQEWLAELSANPYGLALLIVPGQLVFLALAFGGGLFSRSTFRIRLALHGGRLPILIWPLIALGTPTIGLIVSWIVTAYLEKINAGPQGHLENLSDIITTYGDNRVYLLISLMALLPALAEEIFFRGYLQSKLTRELPIPVGILITALLFAFAHIDPVQMLMVFPIGIWLGYIAWRCGSTWPAIFGHLTNNLASIIGVQLVASGWTEVQFFQTALLSSAPFFVLTMALLVSIPIKRQSSNKTPSKETQ